MVLKKRVVFLALLFGLIARLGFAPQPAAQVALYAQTMDPLAFSGRVESFESKRIHQFGCEFHGK
jgi:hypothetical protein